ncbi:DUF3263 domain-containing protein [Kitasatospora sp. NPDC006697]|uniref:DUF3263 domain-containing protein n=1 Tax=unclassified Kitasatospora TaxID=2633591 RepID=UPI0036BCB1DE
MSTSPAAPGAVLPPPAGPGGASDGTPETKSASRARLALGERDAALLDFEYRHWPKSTTAAPGPKEAAIRAELGISPTRYYQLLNGLLDSEAALARHPVMVNRLRAVRESLRIARQ